MERDTKIGIIYGLILAALLVPMVLFWNLTPEPRAYVPTTTVKPEPVKYQITDQYGNVTGYVQEVRK